MGVERGQELPKVFVGCWTCGKRMKIPGLNDLVIPKALFNSNSTDQTDIALGEAAMMDHLKRYPGHDVQIDPNNDFITPGMDIYNPKGKM